MKTMLVVAMAFASLTTGCGAIDTVIDCHAICSRYADCYDSKYDVGGCESRCRGHSSSDTEYRNRADQCGACINDRACVNVAFNCSSQCVAVVP